MLSLRQLLILLLVGTALLARANGRFSNSKSVFAGKRLIGTSSQLALALGLKELRGGDTTGEAGSVSFLDPDKVCLQVRYCGG
jgi:hypothetical protein